MNKHSTSLISRRTAVTLAALIWSSLAFCGEIHYAAEGGNLAMVKTLLKDNPTLVTNKDDIGRTPLQVAVFHGHKDMVELLLANNADINAKDNKGRTPLHQAAYHGTKDMVEILLANKADINAKENDATTPSCGTRNTSGERKIISKPIR